MNLRELVDRIRTELMETEQVDQQLRMAANRLQEHANTLGQLIGDLGPGESGLDGALMLLHDASTHAGQAAGITFSARTKGIDYLQRF